MHVVRIFFFLHPAMETCFPKSLLQFITRILYHLQSDFLPIYSAKLFQSTLSHLSPWNIIKPDKLQHFYNVHDEEPGFSLICFRERTEAALSATWLDDYCPYCGQPAKLEWGQHLAGAWQNTLLTETISSVNSVKMVKKCSVSSTKQRSWASVMSGQKTRGKKINSYQFLAWSLSLWLCGQEVTDQICSSYIYLYKFRMTCIPENLECYISIDFFFFLCQFHYFIF